MANRLTTDGIKDEIFKKQENAGNKKRLEIDVHTFIINLIPFGHGSFDVIIGMDWLSKLRAKIVYFEKIVQIPLSNEEILEVHRERPEGNLKQLKSIKVDGQKLKDIHYPTI
ncbi:putative reverse transcriptase domain-containing protein, partial [Tanacetum coccineum]